MSTNTRIDPAKINLDNKGKVILLIVFSILDPNVWLARFKL